MSNVIYLDDFRLDFYEIEHIREHLPLIDVEDLTVEEIELLELDDAS